jgi:uncharacterized protein YndB with AHSA1/START domain
VQTVVRRLIRAPRADVYRALLDPDAVQQWMVPDGMISEVHLLEPRVGGRIHVTLTYAQGSTGKTSPRTDTFSGTFVRLVQDEEVVQSVAFDTDDPAVAGQMTLTYRLVDVDGGTEISGVHDDLPPGVSASDNELGWAMSLAKLAGLVERPPGVR